MSKNTTIEVTKRDFEAEFQKELLEKHIYWKSLGQSDYANAYLVLLHNFTKPEINE
jgi:hypothetical protein